MLGVILGLKSLNLLKQEIFGFLLAPGEDLRSQKPASYYSIPLQQLLHPLLLRHPFRYRVELGHRNLRRQT